MTIALVVPGFVVVTMLSCWSLPLPGRSEVRALQVRGTTGSELRAIQQTVHSFLKAWLVERDVERAKSAFGRGAAQNEAMLQAPCAGFIKAEDRHSESARREGIERFLRDFLPRQPVKSLGQALNRELAVRMGRQFGTQLANDPATDRYVLARLTKDQFSTGSSEGAEYLRNALPHGFWVSFVPIGDGTVYFVWVSEGTTWRIFHASLVCM
jgi:hypothetical protein